ncbi:MAG TPA: serine/threonine-protein kinase [Candidatus Omnitrophota bacterium]|nr:serine/threonine-protein kinase [Candidatus Omnitrophota bacterium]
MAGIERPSATIKWMGEFKTNHPLLSRAASFSFPLLTGGAFGVMDLMMSYWVIRGSLAISAPLGIVAGMLISSAISSKIKLTTVGASQVRNLEGRLEASEERNQLLDADLKAAKEQLAKAGKANADDLGVQFIKVKEVGSGAQATVYLVLDRGVDQARILKLPKISTATEFFGGNLKTFLGKFAFEAKNLGKLNSPNIVRVFQYGEMELEQYMKFTGESINPAKLQGIRKIPYILMEEVEGESLEKKLDDERAKGHNGFPIPYAAHKLWHLTEALKAMKAQNITHRDVKTANIIGTSDGIKLIDFGLARDVMGTGTQLGEVMGSPGYMAPEQMGQMGQAAQAQIMGVKEMVQVGWHSDLFSAGAVFWDMITGAPLDQDVTNPAAYVMKHNPPSVLKKLKENNDRLTFDLDAIVRRIDRPDPSINQFKMELQVMQKGLIARLQKVLDKTLAVDVRKRYQDHDELQADLNWIVENHNQYLNGLGHLMQASNADVVETAVKPIPRK